MSILGMNPRKSVLLDGNGFKQRNQQRKKLLVVGAIADVLRLRPLSTVTSFGTLPAAHPV